MKIYRYGQIKYNYMELIRYNITIWELVIQIKPTASKNQASHFKISNSKKQTFQSASYMFLKPLEKCLVCIQDFLCCL